MKARVALLASLFSLCLVAFVSAQVSTTTGTVVSNSGGTLVVDTDSGQRTFMVDAQSSLPADLAAGTRVTVEYHTLANDKFHAFKVTPAGTSPTSAATTATDTMTAPPADTTTTTTTTTAPETAPAPAAPAPAAPTMAAPTTAPTTTTTTTTTQAPPAGTMNDTTTSNTTTRTTMDDDSSTTGSRLPATASPLPLLALAGSLALAGGVLLRRRRA